MEKGQVNMTANVTYTLATMTIHYATVSPTLLDVDWFQGQDVPCCQCGANLIRIDQRMGEGAIRQCDARGEYVECDACGMRHYADGGRFLFHGDMRTRLEYWCATCAAWRSLIGRSDICHVCKSRLRRD